MLQLHTLILCSNYRQELWYNGLGWDSYRDSYHMITAAMTLGDPVFGLCSGYSDSGPSVIRTLYMYSVHILLLWRVTLDLERYVLYGELRLLL